MHVRAVPLLLITAYLSAALAQAPRIAVIGGGLGGTSSAYFLRESNPTWHLELFERGRIGGRTEELHYAGRVLELGASIIHGQNQYVLSLAKAVNLTPTQGDDTDSSFSIYDGSRFVFKQSGSRLRDILSVLRRYGISPLRYKWLSEAMGRRFAGVYELQHQGQAFTTPQEMLERLGLYVVTQQSALDYMKGHLATGLWKYGADNFINELAGAINRINYNQHNAVLNAMAGLVSYLPAAQPDIYYIKEGNALLPDRLAAAAAFEAVHVGTAVQIVRLRLDGRYDLVAVPPAAAAGSSDGLAAARKDTSWQQQQQQENVVYGPYDAVVLSTPLEGSGIKFEGLPEQRPDVGNRTYQTTVTTFVVGDRINPQYFSVEALPPGDIFVTDSADTPFTVIADKGLVTTRSAAAAAPATQDSGSINGPLAQDPNPADPGTEHCESQDSPAAAAAAAAARDGFQQQQQQQQQRRLWKVFSEVPLSDELIQKLFRNGSVVISREWKAYPRFHPPEGFAPFMLNPGLCYVNALENAASALEVAAVAAKNCALLLSKQLGEKYTNSYGHTGQPVSEADRLNISTQQGVVLS